MKKEMINTKIIEVKRYIIDSYGFDKLETAQEFLSFYEKGEIANSYIKKNIDCHSKEGIENSEEALENFDRVFCELLESYKAEYSVLYFQCKRGIIGRYLDDSQGQKGRLLNKLYFSNVSCVGEKDGKSYSQPYYAVGK